VKLDTITLPLESGDVIVLCTDGAWKPRGEQFVRLVAQGDEALDEILSERAARDGRPTRPSDNATAIVVRVDLVREEPSHFG
jgi:serine/threonine protein phosphatase PrpC